MAEAEKLDFASAMYKVEWCSHIKTGRLCPNGDSCRFAHSLEEKREHPVKLFMCLKFKEGQCDRGERCLHAHHRQELRSLERCLYYSYKTCKHGDLCHKVHGEYEMQHRMLEEKKRQAKNQPPPQQPPSPESLVLFPPLLSLPSSVSSVLSPQTPCIGIDTRQLCSEENNMNDDNTTSFSSSSNSSCCTEVTAKVVSEKPLVLTQSVTTRPLAAFVIDAGNWLHGFFAENGGRMPRKEDFRDLIIDTSKFFCVKCSTPHSTYITMDPRDQSDPNKRATMIDLHNGIERLGFTLECCNMTRYQNNELKQKDGDSIVSVVLMEAFAEQEIDIVILVSGDGDFVRALQSNKKSSKRKPVFVVGFGYMVKPRLRSLADRGLDLSTGRDFEEDLDWE